MNTPGKAGPGGRFRVRSIPDAWVYFALKPDGSVDLMRMAAVSPSTDFSYNWHDLMLRRY